MHNTIIDITSYRKQWVDYLRGLAMIMVIFGHTVPQWNEYFVFTSPIKIPLFFAITGYIFKDRDGDWKIFLKKLMQGIIIPWIFLSILPVAALSIVKMDLSGFVTKTIDILVGKDVWYMPACIVAEIIWFAILKYSRSSRLIYINAIGLFFIGLLLAQFKIFDFFMISRGFVAQLFLLIGYSFKEYESKRYKINMWGVLIFAGLYFCVGVISLLLYPSYSLDVHLNYYYNYIICFLMIISGNFLLFCVSSRANVRLHILEFIGKHSLIFYIWSGYASFIFTKILTITGITENVNYQLIGLIKTVGACIILSVAAVTLNWIKQKLAR